MKVAAPVSIRVSEPYFGDPEAVLADLRSVLETGRLVDGPFVRRFEEAFRARVGVRHAVAVNSCTTALEIILRHLNVQGQEVVVPTNTFIATANAVLYAGGKPAFADIDPVTFCLSPNGLRQAITPRTRAVILVHIAGRVTPHLKEIQEICDRHPLPLLEDCAHAHGSMHLERAAGALGHAGAFSFYPTKIMTTGSGGMITTDDPDLAQFARSVRFHGRGEEGKDLIVELGNDWFMDEMSAAMGYHQLVRLEEMVARRNQIAERYRQLLGDLPDCTLPAVPAGTRHSYYKIPLLVNPGIDVAALKQSCLQKHGVELESLYNPPCHLQPVYRRLFGFQEGLFPVAEDVLKRQICLPVHMGIGEEEISYVMGALTDGL